ncbi:hypothetical protein PR048_018241 [Dryococelus australis]|uniref:Uncharacterized protein n=1 Tax=Dryococelus australis TaxID=614101 RepID=A0ABQ9HBY8_9NEOP|nr:hypothetical protein PR048_018241 [Dryococelus australis]
MQRLGKRECPKKSRQTMAKSAKFPTCAIPGPLPYCLPLPSPLPLPEHHVVGFGGGAEVSWVVSCRPSGTLYLQRFLQALLQQLQHVLLDRTSDIATPGWKEQTCQLKHSSTQEAGEGSSQQACCVAARVRPGFSCKPSNRGVLLHFDLKGQSKIFACGNRADDAAGQRVFSGISGFPRPFNSGADPYSPESPSSALKTSLSISAQKSLLHFTGIRCYQILRKQLHDTNYRNTRDEFAHRTSGHKARGKGEHVGVVVRPLPSHEGVPGSIHRGSLPDFRMWESCRTMPLVGRLSRESPVSPCPCIATLLHCHLISIISALWT